MTTTYAQNVGLVAPSRIRSRYVVTCCGTILMLRGFVPVLASCRPGALPSWAAREWSSSDARGPATRMVRRIFNHQAQHLTSDSGRPGHA